MLRSNYSEALSDGENNIGGPDENAGQIAKRFELGGAEEDDEAPLDPVIVMASHRKR